MITLLESFLPKWLIEAIVVVIVLACGTLYLEHRGAAQELVKQQKSSAALIAQTQKQNAQTVAQYAAAQKANQEKTDEALNSVAAVQSQLADSVRGFEAYRRAHPAVESAGGVGVAAGSGECGSEDCGAVVERLAVRGNELAGSLGAVVADLQSCQRDRDALTGQPRLTTAPE